MDKCEDGIALGKELGKAYKDAWISGDQAFRDARVATYSLIGETEEDAVRAGKLPPHACRKRS